MIKEIKHTYSKPNDDHAIVSEPVTEYTTGSSDSIVLHVPKGHDADKLRSKVMAYFNILLSADDDTEKEFYRHLKKWQEETMMLSSPTMIINNASFQKIISMGKVSVPYILQEIRKRPSCLVWALNIIYNRRITDNKHTTISEACKLWVKELEWK